MTEIAQRQLRNDNAEILRRVEAGETFTITRNGRPVAELRPVPAGRQRYVSKSALRELARQTEPIDLVDLRAALDEVASPWVDDA